MVQGRSGCGYGGYWGGALVVNSNSLLALVLPPQDQSAESKSLRLLQGHKIEAR